MHVLRLQWSVEETTCLLAVWSSAEVQAKLEGATRTKPILAEIKKEMAAAGYERSIEQISNKLKKLKKEYRDHKKDPRRSGNMRPTRNPHFDILDWVLGERPANNAIRNGTICYSPGSAQAPGPDPDRPSDRQENSAGPANFPPPSTPHAECCSSPPVSPAKPGNSNTRSPTPPVHPSTPPPPVLTPPPALISAHLPCTSSPVPLHSLRASDRKINIDAVTFWKSCNQAARTQAIFSDFISDINDISCRIQSDQASHEDYVTALRVMEASGKLSALVAKQEKELNKRQEEVQLAVSAMKKARSVLRQNAGHDS